MRKTGDFGGFGREKGGQKGVFGASKSGKMVLFCVREGEMGVEGGISGQYRTLCLSRRPPENHPQGQLERCDSCERRSHLS